MLTVWCVLNGNKYADNDVHILHCMVSRNIVQPFRFRCLADREIQGIDTFIPDEQWPGWWSKLLLFRYATGQCLYLDLDTVIVGNLDRLLSTSLSMPANWAQSGHGGCQSSVMSWDASSLNYAWIADRFNPIHLGHPERGNCGIYVGAVNELWGDQEFITELLGNPGDIIKPMPHIYSYKYHCKRGLPNDASVICFHGKPKPEEVSDTWVKESRYTQIQV